MNDSNEFNKNFKKILPYGVMIFTIILALMCIYFIVNYWANITTHTETITNILQPVIFGLALAYLINPVMKRVESTLLHIQKKHKSKSPTKLRKFNRTISIFISYAIVFLFFYLVLKIILPGVQESVVDIVNSLPDKLNVFWNTIDSHIKSNEELEAALKVATNEVTALIRAKSNDFTEIFDLASKIVASLKSFVYFILNIVIGIIVSIYILAEKEKFKTTAKKIIYATFPVNFSNTILKTTREVDRIFSGFVIGKIIDSIIIGFICYIAMLILRLPYAVLISVIIGITNVIPFFGPFIGAIPSALIIFLTDPKQGVYFIVMIIVLQQLDGNIIGPKILGNKIGISSFWVVFSILLSGGLFNFTGMLLGVPVFASLYYILSVIVNKRLQSKGLPVNTLKYNNLLKIKERNQNYELIYHINNNETDDLNEQK